jgi:imidazolonepropionase-like amidohydrolase
MMRRATTLLFLAACSAAAMAQTTAPPAASKRTAIRVSRLIDGKGGPPMVDAVIVVEGDKIVSVTAGGTLPQGADTFTFGNATALPGLIDTHTHILLQGDITAADYDEQLLKQSIPYRAVLAARNARLALDHGITTMRDLETEGAMYADVDVKTAIERGEVPGSRMIVATRGMAPTGMYPLGGYSWEIDVPHGVQLVDGVDGARLAVRQQISRGADWIKYYADRGYFFAPDGVLRSRVNFTDEEARAIVDEAHRQGRRVAAHAMASDGVAAALRAGVDSIEHGFGITDEQFDQMAAKGVFWVPTVMVGAHVAPGRGGNWPRMVELERTSFPKALKKGVKIAFGTDAGGYAWTALLQARELKYYVDYGMTTMAAIRSATAVAAELLGMQDRLGTIEAGKIADIIIVPRDPLANITELEKVQFVMKAGVVHRNATP